MRFLNVFTFLVFCRASRFNKHGISCFRKSNNTTQSATPCCDRLVNGGLIFGLLFNWLIILHLVPESFEPYGMNFVC